MGNSPLRSLGQSVGIIQRPELTLIHAAARGDFEAVKQLHQQLNNQGVFSPNNQSNNQSTRRTSFSFRRGSIQKSTSVPTSPTNVQSPSQSNSQSGSQFDVNYHLPDGDFALMLAVAHGNVTFVEYLVEELQCDVDNVDSHGCTSLMTAIQRQSFDIVKYLCLDGQCDMCIIDEDGRTAMHYAALQDSSEILRFMCSIDANESLVAAKDVKANTPLLTLLLENRLAKSLTSVQQMAVALLDAGSDPSWCNLDGVNAWQAASQRDMKEKNMFEIAESGTAGILATAVRRRQRKRRQVIHQVFNVFELANEDNGVDDSIKTDSAIDDVLDVIASYDNHQVIPSDLAEASISPSLTPTHRSNQASVSQLSISNTSQQVSPAAAARSPTNTAVELVNAPSSSLARALTVNPTETQTTDAVDDIGSGRGLLSPTDDAARTSSQASITSP